MNTVTTTITHIDLFAGPGGIATGFKAAGINTILANEYIDSVCDTYEANHPDTEMLRGDIRELTDEIIKTKLREHGLQSIDIVSGGFPCETFSTAGATSRASNDHRNLLYKEIIRIANAANAKVVLFENVPAFMTKKVVRGENELYFDLLMKDLKDSGYKYIKHTILNASHYGVPQLRKRFILIASKTLEVGDIELAAQDDIVTVEDAFSDLPQIEDNLTIDIYRSSPQNTFQDIMRSQDFWGVQFKDRVNDRLTYHITPKHRPATKLRFELIQQGEGLRNAFLKHSDEEVAELQSKKILPKKWFIQRNYRLVPSLPSKTVTSHALDELVHPYLNRGLSVREVARLQGFPDWYDFKGGPLIAPHMGKIQDKYEQIGDAVPPLLARELGIYLSNLLRPTTQRVKYSKKQNVI